MEFKYVETCLIEPLHLSDAVSFCHSWQSENNMTANINTSLSCPFYCLNRTFVCMTSVYAFQHLVVGTFYAILHNHKSLSVELFKIIKNLV